MEMMYRKEEFAEEDRKMDRLRVQAREQQRHLIAANHYFKQYARSHRQEMSSKLKKAYGRGPFYI